MKDFDDWQVLWNTTMKLKSIDYHRNGVCGIGFHVIEFTWLDKDCRPTVNRRMLATVFPEAGAIAVLDIEQTHEGNLEFANGNSWRGDHFEGKCREWIKAYSDLPIELLGCSMREKRIGVIQKTVA